MKNRLISAAVIIAVFLVAVFTSSIPFVLSGVVALVSAAALYEVLSVTKCAEGRVFRNIGTLFAVTVPFLTELTATRILEKYNVNFSVVALAAVFIYTLILFCTILISNGKYSFEHLGTVFLMSVIIPFFFSTIVSVNHKEYGILYVILMFLCSWGADTGGYIFGCLFGRKKFAPHISPKKTFAGVIGALATAVSVCILIGYCAGKVGTVPVDYVSLAICGVVGGMCAITGDLIASMIKRSFGVKDFGNLIPGHGGIMDRFDSVLFASPAIYLIITVMPAFGSN